MNSTWIKVYTTENEYEAEIVKEGLMAIDIEAVVMNKQDSSYRNFGVLTVLVHPDNYQQAIEHLSQNDI